MASLKELLKELDDPNPTSSVDPENDEFGLTNANIVYKKTQDEGEASEDEKNQFGTLRVRSSLLQLSDDPKYAGRKVSRNDLLSDFDTQQGQGDKSDDEEYQEELQSVDSISDRDENHLESPVEQSDDEMGFDENSNSSYSDIEEDTVLNIPKGNLIQGTYDNLEEEPVKTFTPDQNTEDVSKGKAVKCQLEIWDKLLENRIRLQKGLLLSNRLPQYDKVSEFKASGGSQLAQVSGNARSSLVMLLSKLLDLQKKLLEMNPETKSILIGQKVEQTVENDDDEEIPSDSDDENNMFKEETTKSKIKYDKDTLKLPSKRKHTLTVPEFEEEISKRYKAFKPYRDSTISKWYEKTRLGSGKLHSKSFSSFDKSVLTQVKQILTDKDRLIKRTQLKRSIYKVLGKLDASKSVCDESGKVDADSHLKDYDPEIFDDDDYYHQLLKELIERKSNISTTDDPITMGRQWLELQKLRTKVKRKIDTKASKGRRIRYNIHPKLVSYMAPIAVGSMQDQSRNDLFSSLFGKRSCEPLR